MVQPTRLLAGLLSLLFALLVSFGTAGGAAADRVALVIGNSEYNTNPLVNPENDARDMAMRLQEIGFRVHGDGPLLQQSLREMQVAIRDFTRNLRNGDLAVFYFAGHGVEYKGTNFLIPVDDEEIAFAEDVPDWAYPAPRLLERLASTGATGVIILDACRNNPLPERGGARDQGTGLSAMQAPRGASAFIMYAAAPGQTSSDGDGRNGLFTSALLEALERPARRIDDIMYQVSFSVRNQTEGRQLPWLEFAFAGEVPPQFQLTEGFGESNEPPTPISDGLNNSGKPGHGINRNGQPLFGAQELTAPLAEDGLVVQLLAGGYEDAAQLGNGCEGFVARNPDFHLTWNQGAGAFTVAARANERTMLVVGSPDGSWICQGAPEGAQGPQVDIAGPEVGTYRFWVGTVEESTEAPEAELVFFSLTDADGAVIMPEAPVGPAPASIIHNPNNPIAGIDRSLE